MEHAQHRPARRIARAPSDAIQVRCCYWQFPALGYRVYYGTAPATYIQPFTNGLDVAVPTTTLTGLTSGMTYYFAVTVVDTSSPQRESTYSNEVSAIIR